MLILLLQETWLVPGNLCKLNDINTDFITYGISAMDNNEVLHGRPHGGAAILWHKRMAPYVIRTQCDSKRLCAVSVSCDIGQLLIVNCYMPVDNYTKSYVTDEFLSACDSLENVINKHPNHHVVICGDLNIDFSRTNAHDKYFKQLMEQHNCIIGWDFPCAVKDYTFSNLHTNTFTHIDHFCFGQGLHNKIRELNVYDDSANLSGHRPVIARLNVKPNCVYLSNERLKCESHILWHKVTQTEIARYQMAITCQLEQLTSYNVQSCKNINCKDQGHLQDIDNWCDKLVSICLVAGQCFPRNRNSNKHKCIPGWKSQVKPYKDELKFWYFLWKQEGKPHDGVAYNNMRNSRKQYMYAIRRCKKQNRKVRFQKMAESVLQDNSRSFFKEVKRINGAYNTRITCINGETQAQKITELFAGKYKELFSSVPSNSNAMQEILCYVNENIGEVQNAVITEDMLRQAINKLKFGKNDGDVGLYSDHIIHAPESMCKQLAGLLTVILLHGYQPDKILSSTIYSIPKDNRGDLCIDSNYRGIALASCIGKVFDLVILARNMDKLKTSSLQFAFKPHMGTTMCTLIIKEVINYYNKNGSNIYSCFLDATKAFDRVRYDQLFSLLLKRKLNAVDIRALLDLYSRQRTRTVWDGAYSASFTSINGIRQGSIASPIMYCVYMDELLKRLELQGYGCWMGHHYVGSVCYADDLTLISPTVNALRQMIHICEQYATDYGVQYNSSKSLCVLFSRQKQSRYPKISLNGAPLAWQNHVKHLGNYLSYNLSEEMEISVKKRDLIGQANTIIANIGDAPVDVLLKIFSSQCGHFYGCQAWSFTDSQTNQYYTMWNRIIRRLLRLPWQTHTRFLPHLIDSPHCISQIFHRFVKMVDTMQTCENYTVNYIVNKCVNSADSIIGGNLRYIEKETNSDRKTLLILHKTLPMEPTKLLCSNDDICKVTAIRDLLFSEIPYLDFDEKQLMLNILCTE